MRVFMHACVHACVYVLLRCCHEPSLMTWPLGIYMTVPFQIVFHWPGSSNCLLRVAGTLGVRARQLLRLPPLVFIEAEPGQCAPCPLWFLQKCEKLVLSLCCNSLSLPFHEPVSPLVRRPLLVLPASFLSAAGTPRGHGHSCFFLSLPATASDLT